MPKKCATHCFGACKINCADLAGFVNCSPFAHVNDGVSRCAVNKGLIYNAFSWWSAYEQVCFVLKSSRITAASV